MPNNLIADRTEKGAGAAGVFCCTCRGKYGFRRVKGLLRDTDGVALACEHPSLCSREGLDWIQRMVEENALERVLITACSVYEKEGLFRRVLGAAGVDPHRFTLMESSAADPTAVRMGLKRLFRLEPIEVEERQVAERALVIGAGLAGLRAAVNLADMGLPVTVVDEEAAGDGAGELTHPPAGREGADPGRIYHNLLDRARRDDLIRLCIPGRVREIEGQIGNFRVRYGCCQAGKNDNYRRPGPGPGREERVGAVILATGCRPAEPEGWDLELGAEVFPLSRAREEFRSLEGENPPDERGYSLALVVGERDTGASFAAALEAALEARRRLKCEVYLLCPHARVAAPGLEELYRRARERGVIVIRYDQRPDVELNPVPRSYLPRGQRFYPLTVTVAGAAEVPAEFLTTAGAEAAAAGNLTGGAEGDTAGAGARDAKDADPGLIRLGCDRLILSGGFAPREESARLAEGLGLEVGPLGFFQEDNVHLLPVQTARRGIFVAGGCRGPMLAGEELDDGDEAALAALSILRRGRITVDWNAAVVDPGKCAYCLTCMRSCPHGAVELDDAQGSTRIVRAACQGCGTCAGECPADAIQLEHYTDEQLLAELSGFGGWEDD